MNHKDTKDTKEEADRISHLVLGAGLEVHRIMGPGLLESVNEECLAHEFVLRRITFERQKALPLQYKARSLQQSYRVDFLVEGLVVVELKAVDQILPVHEAQVLTYLRLSSLWLGLLLNFNACLFRAGIRRLVN